MSSHRAPRCTGEEKAGQHPSAWSRPFTRTPRFWRNLRVTRRRNSQKHLLKPISPALQFWTTARGSQAFGVWSGTDILTSSRDYVSFVLKIHGLKTPLSGGKPWRACSLTGRGVSRSCGGGEPGPRRQPAPDALRGAASGRRRWENIPSLHVRDQSGPDHVSRQSCRPSPICHVTRK